MKVKTQYEGVKVQKGETHIASKCDEIRSGEGDAEVVVELLFKRHFTFLGKQGLEGSVKNGEQKNLMQILLRKKQKNKTKIKQKKKTMKVLPSLHLDVKDPDEVRPLWVVFNQTGDAAAPLAPAGVAVRCEHLDHGGGQRLWRSRQC